MTTKNEPQPDLESVKRDIMNLVQAYDNGLSEVDLSRTMSSISAEVRMNAINSLTNEGKVQLCKRGSDLIYRCIDAKLSAHQSGNLGSNISLEERAVYLVVESAGCKGIWNRELRNQTKLSMQQMTKVLKQLETKKLIKAVKSVTASKRKVYMLYGLEPDKSVTGGAWYSGTEFESEYVQVLHEQCYQFIKRRLTPASGDDPIDFVEAREQQLVTSAQVKEYIEDLKISNVKLTLPDIEMVLDTIVFDGLIEKITVRKPRPNATMPLSRGEKGCSVSDDEEMESSDIVTNYYRALIKLVESTGVMKVPCGQCPYVNECRPHAVINPNKCQYLDRWF